MEPKSSLFLTNIFGDSDAQSRLRTIILYSLEQRPPNSYLGFQWIVFWFNSHLSLLPPYSILPLWPQRDHEKDSYDCSVQYWRILIP